MAEPQPPLSSLDTDEPHPLNPPPTNADDRKAAAALSSLDAHDEDESKENLQKANIDPEALGRAISWLEIRSGEKGQKEGAKGSGIDKGKDVDGEKKKIKLDQGDVTLLVRREISSIFGLHW